jgi:hypothetical protein
VVEGSQVATFRYLHYLAVSLLMFKGQLLPINNIISNVPVKACYEHGSQWPSPLSLLPLSSFTMASQPSVSSEI